MTTPEAHDRDMAVVQGLTHLIAHSLAQLGPLPTRLANDSFAHLLQAARMVAADSPDLLDTILRRNRHAAPLRRAFLEAAQRVAAE